MTWEVKKESPADFELYCDGVYIGRIRRRLNGWRAHNAETLRKAQRSLRGSPVSAARDMWGRAAANAVEQAWKAII